MERAFLRWEIMIHPFPGSTRKYAPFLCLLPLQEFFFHFYRSQSTWVVQRYHNPTGRGELPGNTKPFFLLKHEVQRLNFHRDSVLVALLHNNPDLDNSSE